MHQYELEHVDPKALVDYPLNAKKHTEAQIQALAKEIGDVGFRVPIVIDHEGVIISGHGRKAASILAGLDAVPVHRLPADFDPARIRAMRLFDNKIAETGIDEKLLRQELSELVSLDGFDFSWTGFAESEIVDISPSKLDDEEENKDPESSSEQEADEDDTEGAAIPAVIPERATPGSVWKLGRHLLVCGDSSDAALVHAHIGEHEAHAIVTDPPYGLGEIKDLQGFVGDWLSGGSGDEFVGTKGFMGKWWDRTVPPPSLWKVWLSRARPGAHALVFSGTRTQDLMTLGLRIAGVEVRDQLAWIYGQGFPKSLDVSGAIDKEAGATREVVGRYQSPEGTSGASNHDERIGTSTRIGGLPLVTAPATDAAREWKGWGTALKPSQEPITLARIPLSEDTVAANVLKWGTGALNIDECRVGNDGGVRKVNIGKSGASHGGEGFGCNGDRVPIGGRFPANLILDEEAAQALDAQSGLAKPKPARTGLKGGNGGALGAFAGSSADAVGHWPADEGGGASRFFYVAKASKSDRGQGNTHPTVKPVALMRYLVRLVTPEGGTVLEPFCGSGTTLLACEKEGVACRAFEQDPHHCDIILARWEGLTGQKAELLTSP